METDTQKYQYTILPFRSIISEPNRSTPKTRPQPELLKKGEKNTQTQKPRTEKKYTNQTKII